ncbi:MAG: SufD family Fe-S cluster assembly protein [Oscillospiraceae bacterium]|jgi:Fe-S cluster assembly scaffold protein SufB|nr:SufD family Fe-S cluster assembly protein [Oscillospiraceae bacterium]
MQVKTNVLPAPTWRYIGVNYDTIEQLEKFRQGNIMAKCSDPAVKAIAPEKIAESDASANCGYMIDTAELSGTLRIEYFSDGGDLADYSIITAREGTDAMAVFTCGGDVHFHNGLTRIIAEKNSRLTLIKIHGFARSEQAVDSILANVGENAELNIISLELGGAHSLTNYQIELDGEASRAFIDSACLAKGREVMDISYRINHRGKNSVSSITCSGALKGQARKTFKGTLDFRKGSSGSKGSEIENVTLLDRGVVSRSVPIILCTEDDVEGSHAASAGRIDEDVLFYITSRGIPMEEARRLIVFSKIAPVVDKIPFEDLRDGVNIYLENYMCD